MYRSLTEPEQVEELDTKQSLSETIITDENTALNVLVSFLNLAQRRGAFAMNESAKIWECIQTFVKDNNGNKIPV